MKELLKRYEEKEPEIVFHWRDQETDAEGWTVINSLRGGAAGGGTRMRKGLNKNEVLSLAKRWKLSLQFLDQLLVVQNQELTSIQMTLEKEVF